MPATSSAALIKAEDVHLNGSSSATQWMIASREGFFSAFSYHRFQSVSFSLQSSLIIALAQKLAGRSGEALVDQAEQSALRSVSKKTEAASCKKNSRKKSRLDIQKGGFK
jgi:uncharacterized OB-fold protein